MQGLNSNITTYSLQWGFNNVQFLFLHLASGDKLLAVAGSQVQKANQ